MNKKRKYPVNKKEINNLLNRIAGKDFTAFDILYPKMNKSLYYFLLRFNLDKYTISEITSLTFSTIVEQAPTKTKFTNGFSWILTIAKNHMYNIVSKKDDVSFDDDFIDKLAVHVNYDSLNMKLIMEKMDPQSQSILYYIFYEGFTLEETAKILKISLSTIKRRKEFLLTKFKEILTDE